MALKAEWRGVPCAGECAARWTTARRLRVLSCGPRAVRLGGAGIGEPSKASRFSSHLTVNSELCATRETRLFNKNKARRWSENDVDGE